MDSKAEPATLLLFEASKFMRVSTRVCLIFFCGIDVCCILFGVFIIFFDPDRSIRHPVAATVFFVSFWTFWVLLSIWNVLDTKRHRLELREDGIFQQGVFSRRQILWKDVVAISWGTWGYSSITVASSTTFISIPTKFLRKEQRQWLTEFFRKQFSKQIQHQYRQFRANELLWRLPQCEPQWIQWCKSIFISGGFISVSLWMFAGWWMQSGVLLLTGFGAWALLAALLLIFSRWEWRHVVERLGAN